MRRFFILLISLFICLTCFRAAAQNLPVRLHVRAQNDTEEAQALKMKVKDSVLTCALEITNGCETAQEAYAELFKNTGVLRNAARKAAFENGFEGKVSVQVTREYFPARLYGDTVLKEGVYPGVCIEIGEGEGRNWWCVIYPEYCLKGLGNENSQIRFYSSLRSFISNFFG